MEEDTRPYYRVSELTTLRNRGPFYCYFIVSPANLRPDSYDACRRFLEVLISRHTINFGHCHESFLFMSQAREREATERFGAHARHWLPEAGLGVLPHRPPPRMLCKEDIFDFDPDEPLRPMVNTVFRVTSDESKRLDAMRTMLGTGTTLQIVSGIENRKLLVRLKELFLSQITDRVFRIFPWYVPMIDMEALGDSISPLTLQSLEGIAMYIREVREDGGILIVAPQPLGETFVDVGCEQVELGELPKWKLPE